MIKLKQRLQQRDYEPTTGGFKTFNNGSPAKNTMNIYTVRDNLKNTIAGKEAYLAALRDSKNLTDGAAMAVEACKTMLAINIEELEKILADVEVCCEQAVAASWAGCDDRMGK